MLRTVTVPVTIPLPDAKLGLTTRKCTIKFSFIFENVYSEHLIPKVFFFNLLFFIILFYFIFFSKGCWQNGSTMNAEIQVLLVNQYQITERNVLSVIKKKKINRT